MKTTDLAMIFIGIMIPIVIVVYVDISFMLKSEEQRLYYINVINSAINDATYVMKTVEGEEQDVDYGYSGLAEKKITVNARVAVDTFFESLYDNFEITGDSTGEEYIKSHIPALAVVDYNGVYIYSMDEYKGEDGEEYRNFVLKPKRYFSYVYAIPNSTSNKEILEEEEINFDNPTGYTIKMIYFSMDDYITVIDEYGIQNGFYLEDENNNATLYTTNNNTVRNDIKEEIIQHLKIQRSQTISDVVSQEMSYAVNAHNLYSDTDYEFVFPTIALSDWQEMVDNVGIIAFVQGINIGNRTLDYVAHGISGLKITNRYYVSSNAENEMQYYHSTQECSVYKEGTRPIEGYFITKIDAAAAGYYPCPVCKP